MLIALIRGFARVFFFNLCAGFFRVLQVLARKLIADHTSNTIHHHHHNIRYNNSNHNFPISSNNLISVHTQKSILHSPSLISPPHPPQRKPPPAAFLAKSFPIVSQREENHFFTPRLAVEGLWGPGWVPISYIRC